MRSYRFVQVDVFGPRPFGGNPLAVFHQAEGLSAEEMQQLAKEMRF
jgi:trans-2,3-dihydro-3-hydroxyanthranilate isomerase